MIKVKYNKPDLRRSKHLRMRRENAPSLLPLFFLDILNSRASKRGKQAS